MQKLLGARCNNCSDIVWKSECGCKTLKVKTKEHYTIIYSEEIDDYTLLYVWVDGDNIKYITPAPQVMQGKTSILPEGINI